MCVVVSYGARDVVSFGCTEESRVCYGSKICRDSDVDVAPVEVSYDKKCVGDITDSATLYGTGCRSTDCMLSLIPYESTVEGSG